MYLCQGKIFVEGQPTKVCGKPATYKAYHPSEYFCDKCLHQRMEDESPEAQASVEKLEMPLDFDGLTEEIAQRAFQTTMIEEGDGTIRFHKARAAARKALVEYGKEHNKS